MLFCSQRFILFFLAVFAVYWTLDRRWGRVLSLLAAGPPFACGTWQILTCCLLRWPPGSLAKALSSEGIPFPMAGVVAVTAAAAFRVGPDRAGVWLLLGLSFVFYASWSQQLAFIVCLTTLMDYLIARGLDASPARGWRKLLLTLSLVVNLGLLCYFKYANFFLRSLEEALAAAGASAALPVLQVVLPIGISFYTFEAISYTVDVYRRRIKAERRLAHFMLFILFFPHLIAGPIVRGRDFLPQVGRPKRWSWPRLHLGLQLFILGLFKKLAIADHMALFADPVFANPGAYRTGAVWVAAVAYAIQVYCDFSGYSDMAIGCAHLLGYKLALNFDMPYLSANIAEFWRRWHISLSSWLRDYLFIPLGGSRRGRGRTFLNLLVVMGLGGLWHGASWTFVAWGVYHGLLLIAHRLGQQFCKSRPRLDALLQSAPGTASRAAFTFLCVVLGWVAFRATTFALAADMLRGMVLPRDGLATPLPPTTLFCLLSVVVLGHALGRRGLHKRLLGLLPAPVEGLGYACVMTLALVLAPFAGKAFIYFQF